MLYVELNSFILPTAKGFNDLQRFKTKMSKIWTITQMQFSVALIILILSVGLNVESKPIAGGVTSVRFTPVTDFVQKTIQDILIAKIIRTNESLFEMETKKLFAKFLIDLALERNGTQSESPPSINQHLLRVRQDSEVPNLDVDSQKFSQRQQFLQDQQPQNQQITQNQQISQNHQILDNQQFFQGQQIQNQQFHQAQQINQNQQLLQNQQFFQQQQQINPNQQFNLDQVTRAPETFEEVDKLIQHIFRLNVTGVIDQSLYLTGSKPVRNLLGGVLKLVFCDPLSRLLGQCRGNDTIGRRLNITS